MSWNVASPVLERLQELHRRHADSDSGTVATYIPELARADRRWFSICLATTDGRIYEVGDSRQTFTIQSISKPFSYAIALAERGYADTFAHVGVEPSGDAFNAISLDPVTGRPANPMINAGAIATCGLLPGETPEERLANLLERYGRFAGHSLTVDEAVYTSERDTGFRNRAIGFLLRNAEILEADPTPILDLYFRQCSVLVDCRDLAVMAATLAGGGVNPLTGVRAIDESAVESVLSIMGSCGMYDFAGEWMYSVGMPAKSGVSGGICAVLPGHLGIGIFSPPLDANGNSARGIAVCRDLSREFGLHQYAVSRAGREVIHRTYSAAEVSSNRERTAGDRQTLREVGARAVVYELQGSLAFGTTELVVDDVLKRAAIADYVVLDLSRVTHMNSSAAELLTAVSVRLAEKGKRLVFTQRRAEFQALLRAGVREKSLEPDSPDDPMFPDVDLALEWCENRLLALHGASSATADAPDASDITATPETFALLRGLDDAERTAVCAILRPVSYRMGEPIVRAGEPEDSLYLVARGEVTAVLPLLSGHEKRVATFVAGMTFGEMAFLEQSTRSATIYANRDTECWVLYRSDVEKLAATHPRIKAVLMENIALNLCQRLRTTNATLRTLAQ